MSKTHQPTIKYAFHFYLKWTVLLFILSLSGYSIGQYQGQFVPASNASLQSEELEVLVETAVENVQEAEVIADQSVVDQDEKNAGLNQIKKIKEKVYQAKNSIDKENLSQAKHIIKDAIVQTQVAQSTVMHSEFHVHVHESLENLRKKLSQIQSII